MTERLEDLAADEQVKRMKLMSDTISDLLVAEGGTMSLKASREQAAEKLKTTVDEVDYGVVYGEATHRFSMADSAGFLTAIA
ncbi:hypothetical protein LN996_02575 [Arthrobacter sp. AK01]|uniref:hypothetical protein n=1 Tax=Arthrobacter sp. AK01 TaxID=2894084 RepID=UPI001E59ECA9|nr:hypothetical protein [Arthrobacter sp. AK01]MCD4849691.1 hypothetical protein [Arthrobacter sp. AK01]